MTGFTADEQHRLAEAVREACIQAALAGYENAAISGLCHEGAWGAAISAIRMVDLDAVIDKVSSRTPMDCNREI